MPTTIRRANASDDILAVLDVGTFKVACFIAARGLEGGPPTGPAGSAVPARVLGFGHQRARGLKAGVVVDLAEAEVCIREAIAQAQRMAGLEIEKVVLSVSCGRLSSLNFRADARLGSHPVNEADIGRLMAAGQSYAERDGRRLVHMNRINWHLDGQPAIREPRGMRGALLEADLHAVTADETPLRNLLIAVERAQADVTSIVAAPFASGIAVTTAEERRFGVTVLDIGAGVTGLSYFGEGHLLNAEVVTMGGAQITYDIAQALTIPLAEAERIKTLYGSLAAAPSDEHEIIAYASPGAESSTNRVTRARLRRIIKPRADEMFAVMRERIDRNKFSAYASSRIVLTGGGSQLSGMRECAAERLSRPVRVSRPSEIGGLPAGIVTPPFATAVGLLKSLFVPGACMLAQDTSAGGGSPDGYMGQVGNWLRHSF